MPSTHDTWSNPLFIAPSAAETAPDYQLEPQNEPEPSSVATVVSLSHRRAMPLGLGRVVLGQDADQIAQEWAAQAQEHGLTFVTRSDQDLGYPAEYLSRKQFRIVIDELQQAGLLGTTATANIGLRAWRTGRYITASAGELTYGMERPLPVVSTKLMLGSSNKVDRMRMPGDTILGVYIQPDEPDVDDDLLVEEYGHARCLYDLDQEPPARPNGLSIPLGLIRISPAEEQRAFIADLKSQAVGRQFRLSPVQAY